MWFLNIQLINSFVFFTFSFILALFITLSITPFIIKRAIQWKILDTPGDRKVHRYSKPRVGGLGMFAAYISVILLATNISSHVTKAILVGSILITFFGFLDDLFNIRASAKLLIQVLVAYLTASQFIGFGIQIHSLALLSNFTLELGIFAVPFTMCWIIGVMNAINLIDGLDGLAGGICAIASFTLAVSSFIFGQHEAALLFLILLGVILGFLRYNFNPAKVFMGDSGSLFLGYNIAVLSIAGIWNNPKVISFTIPVLVLSIPFYDVATSILRRIKNKQSIFSADSRHLHHRIMELGFTHKQTVIVIYLESLFLALASMSTLLLSSNAAIVVFIVVALMLHFSFIYLKKHFKEIE